MTPSLGTLKNVRLDAAVGCGVTGALAGIVKPKLSATDDDSRKGDEGRQPHHDCKDGNNEHHEVDQNILTMQI